MHCGFSFLKITKEIFIFNLRLDQEEVTYEKNFKYLANKNESFKMYHLLFHFCTQD